MLNASFQPRTYRSQWYPTHPYQTQLPGSGFAGLASRASILQSSGQFDGIPALSPQQPPFFQSSPEPGWPKAEEEDTLLDPRHHLSRSQVLTYLSLGFTLGITGKEILRLFLKRTKADVPFDGDITLHRQAGAKMAPPIENDPFGIPPVQIWRYYKEPLPSMMRAIQEDPTLAKGLLAYVGIGIAGYLVGSLTQGTKETWVRRQETNIRARLVERMQGVLQRSIRSKQTLDNQLRDHARMQISNLLSQHQVQKPEDLLNLAYLPESHDQLFFYQPTHRTIPPECIPGRVQSTPPAPTRLMDTVRLRSASSQRFGNQNSNGLPDFQDRAFLSNPLISSHLLSFQKTAILAVGVLGGLVVQNFIRLFTDALPGKVKQKPLSPDSADPKVNVKTKESIQLNDLENWSLLAFKSKKNLFIAIGLFSITAAAAVGKKLIDGLREIEVTRINAKTELDYQRHNWLTQDPDFHKIAEKEALQNELKLLQQELPWLKNDRVLLRQRIQSILNNVGRNSAPPYFPMTPIVNLVEARS